MLSSPLEQFVVLFFSPLLAVGETYFSLFFLFSNFVFQILVFFVLLFFVIALQRLDIEIFSPWRVLISNYFQFIKGFIGENFHHFARYFYAFFFFFFSFLVLSNLTGMIPYSFAVTSHLVITLFFSFIVFFSCLFFGFYLWGINFLNLFFPKGAPFALAPFLISIELISYSARLFSLAIRLFANIMSGHTLLKILASFAWTLLVSVGSLLGLAPFIIVLCVSGLELVIGFLQAYVFCVLAAIYLNESFYLH